MQKKITDSWKWNMWLCNSFLVWLTCVAVFLQAEFADSLGFVHNLGLRILVETKLCPHERCGFPPKIHNFPVLLLWSHLVAEVGARLMSVHPALTGTSCMDRVPDCLCQHGFPPSSHSLLINILEKMWTNSALECLQTVVLAAGEPHVWDLYLSCLFCLFFRAEIGPKYGRK